MTMTEFAMVEELAFLIKDNLSCKHLVLSIEEILVNSLQDNSSLDGILELEPMSSYHRLLLHRLADIFGFAHESVGEGDDRHLVLQRCSDSSIPSVLVSDILLQYDEYQSPAASTQILKRNDSLSGSRLSASLSVPNWEGILESKMSKFNELCKIFFHLQAALKSREASFPSLTSVEEREAAYLAARERIFSLHDDDKKEPVASKPRNVPVVARRMIAHALGQRICPTSPNLGVSHHNSKEYGPNEEPRVAKKVVGHSNSSPETTKNTKCSSSKLESHERKANNKGSKSSPVRASHSEIKVESKLVRNSPGNTSSLQTGSQGRDVGTQNLEKEHLGAAKRMFAHALGLVSAKGGQSG